MSRFSLSSIRFVLRWPYLVAVAALLCGFGLPADPIELRSASQYAVQQRIQTSVQTGSVQTTQPLKTRNSRYPDPDFPPRFPGASYSGVSAQRTPADEPFAAETLRNKLTWSELLDELNAEHASPVSVGSGPLQADVVPIYHFNRIITTYRAAAFAPAINLRPLFFSATAPVNDLSVHTATRFVRGNRLSDIQTEPMFVFSGVGFPHIELARKKPEQLYKPYMALTRTVSVGNGQKVVPNVACNGYSARTIDRRAARFNDRIQKLSERYAVDVALVKGLITQESCFLADAVSHAGARGLMQLMPETARWLGVKDLDDVNQNLEAGIRYLSQLRRRFGNDELALAAYNAGPGTVERHNGVPPFRETRNYIEKVMHNYHSYASLL